MKTKDYQKAGELDKVKDLLKRLTDEERMKLFEDYCTYCGAKDPRCQCWNDQ